MATEVIHIIDPDNGPGTDYTSLSAWEAAQQRDLVAADEIAIAKCRCTAGTPDVGEVLVVGWTTDTTRYIKIWTDPTEAYRHVGTYPSGNKFRIEHTTKCMKVQSVTCTIEGISLKTTGASSIHCLEFQTVGVLKVDSCVLTGITRTTTAFNGCISGRGSGALHLWNTIIYGWTKGDTTSTSIGIWLRESAIVAFLHNITVVDCGGCINTRAINTTVKNVLTESTDAIGYGFATGGSGTWAAASTNNMSRQSDAPGANSRQSKLATYEDAASDDYTLSYKDVNATDFGTDLTADSDLPFSDDILGVSRNFIALWAIGAHGPLVQKLIANADGYISQNLIFPLAVDPYTVIDDPVDIIDLLDYLYVGTSDATFLNAFKFPDITLLTQKVNFLAVFFEWAFDSGPGEETHSSRPFIRRNEVNYFGTLITAAPTSVYYQWLTRPWDSQPWTPDDLRNGQLELGIELHSGLLAEAQCFQYYSIIEYANTLIVTPEQVLDVDLEVNEIMDMALNVDEVLDMDLEINEVVDMTLQVE